MKNLGYALAFSLLALTAARAQPAPIGGAAPVRKSDPFEKTRQQIEQLFGPRDNPPPFEPARFNPFLLGPVPGAVPETPDQGEPAPAKPASSDDTVLRQLAGQIKVAGFFRRGDKTLLVINGVPRGEGDVVLVPFEGGNATLRIKSVTTGWFVLAYRAAELPVRY